MAAGLVIVGCLFGASAAQAQDTPPQPVDVSQPLINGFAKLGNTLTESHANYSPTPTGYELQWERCNSAGSGCVDISGATAPTYVLVSDDVGQRLRVREVARNGSASSAPQFSQPTAIVKAPPRPVNGNRPQINGSAQPGQTLTVTPAQYDKPPTRSNYRWLRCDAAGQNCADAAYEPSYAVTRCDAQRTLVVEETVTDADGHSSDPLRSEPTAAVPPTQPWQYPCDRAQLSRPAVRGSFPNFDHGDYQIVVNGVAVNRVNQGGSTYVRAGDVLAVTGHLGWDAADPSGFSHAWEASDLFSGVSTILAAGTTYTVTDADAGKLITVLETASNEAGSSQGRSGVGSVTVLRPGEQPPGTPGAPTLTDVDARRATFARANPVPTGPGAKIKRLLALRGYTYTLADPGVSGRVTVQWYSVPRGAKVSAAARKPVLVATGTATGKRPGAALKLKVKLNGAGTKLLKRAKRTQRLTAKVTVAPKVAILGGPPLTKITTFTVRR